MSLYDSPSGDFTPFVKYNAKSGRWSIRKDGQDVEIQNPVFVADLANARKAWLYFMDNQTPQVEYFPSLDAQVPKPSENHKLGISLNLFSEANFGGVVKMESNSINTCSAINELYKLYEDSPESKKGKLPVIKAEGVEPIKGNYGTNYKPVFKIEKWVDRPAAFDEIDIKQSVTSQPESSVSEF
jgi:hypothetical protein